jgi:hypothetical protein
MTAAALKPASEALSPGNRGMKPLIAMRAALLDPALFGMVLDGDSWAAWRVLLIAICGEELTTAERAIFESLTGREREPREPVEEALIIKGRRCGGTRAAGILAAYFGALCDHSSVLAPGERATLPIMSASIIQAGKAMQYIDGIFTHVPALKALVIGQTVNSISLSNGVDIECAAASFRTIRGGTAVAIIADEVAFWRNENTANPDTEILNAARPMLATTAGPLIAITTPYSKRGEPWNIYKRDYGSTGDRLVLVAKASSRMLNPSLPQKVVDRAFERDPASAAAEYGAEFRSDIEAFMSPEAVDAATFPDRLELPPERDVAYYAFVDAAGGSGGGDSMTMAIAHCDGDITVLDCIREVKPPFSPDDTVKDFAATLARYGLREVTGDRWATGFVAEAFEKCGVSYKTSERPKSDIYKELLPLLSSKRVELLDMPRLRAQLVCLERRTARGGRNSIDHPQGAHDDIANSAAGALVIAAGIGRSSGFRLDIYMKAFGS